MRLHSHLSALPLLGGIDRYIAPDRTVPPQRLPASHPLPAASVPAPSAGADLAGGTAMRAELVALPRRELQARAKAAGLKANAKSQLLVEQLLALPADG